MEKNIGAVDRNIRIVIGAILLVIGTFAQLGTGWRAGFIAVAAIALTTAFISF